MSSHQEKFISKLLIGFAFIITSIFFTLYCLIERTRDEINWYFIGIISSGLVCTGLYFMMDAFVHKVKSDFIRRQKVREMQRSKNQQEAV
jgi:hypothetical protein